MGPLLSLGFSQGIQVQQQAILVAKSCNCSFVFQVYFGIMNAIYFLPRQLVFFLDFENPFNFPTNSCFHLFAWIGGHLRG